MTTLNAEQAIAGYMNNKIIMDFVTNEALEKTASDIRAKSGSGTTAKAVELLMARNEQVAARVRQYVASGLVGCYMAA